MSTSSQLPKELRFDVNKLTDYLLNLDHKDGKSKAKFFLSCGYQSSDVLERSPNELNREGFPNRF